MKICFVVEDIYPALNPSGAPLVINGRAVHLKHLGQGLRDAGHDVSYITMDYGQPDGEKISGFTVYRLYRPDEGVPGLRFLTTRVPGLLKALERADADVYVFMCPDPFVGVVAWFCGKKKKKFIYYGGSDRDFDDNMWGLNPRDYHLFRWGLKRADLVLCQNGFQIDTLSEYYGRKGEILRNPMPKAERTYSSNGSIIWVANYRPLKRPEIFIKLAERMKDDFVMVGGLASGYTESEYCKINEAAGRAGIKVVGPAGYDDTDRLISGAKILVNTSEFEGVSNTFLQAWRRGIPVVSFVDPDGMICEYGLGEGVCDLEGLVMAVDDLRKGISEERSIEIKKYFDRTFAQDEVARKFLELVTRMKSVDEI